jgi:hypothetical protein
MSHIKNAFLVIAALIAVALPQASYSENDHDEILALYQGWIRAVQMSA